MIYVLNVGMILFIYLLCIKCWNDPVHIFDPGNWDWCPVYEGTKLQHICQKSITVEQVFNIIKK